MAPGESAIADERSMRSGFLRQAAERPEAPCLVIKDRPLAYGEVEADARRWAGAIVAALGRPARRIGLLAQRSRESYVGVIAALSSGAAFVPLNPRFPDDRTRAMIAQADLDAIIVDRAGLNQLAAILDGLDRAPLLLLPDIAEADLTYPALLAADIAAAEPLRALPALGGEDVAYLLFTSGSTGMPKGVPVTHANALHFLDFMSAHYAITPDDRFSQTFDQTFDLSVFDLFMAWENGASVYAMQPLDLIAPARFVTRNALTIWFSVPSIPALMRKKGSLKDGAMPSLRWSLFCGEPLPVETARAWQAAAPNSAVENLYGPTELTIACLWYRWNEVATPAEAANGVVPIGRPYDGLDALILDDDLQPVEEGELCVAGPQTTPGYWRDPAKTAERFVSIAGERYYRTGDRVRRLASGDHVYLGRTDQQIKVMGYRVELGEIEACLRASPGVVEAVALGWPMEEGTARGIAAFVGGSSIDPAALRARARAALPDYMVPGEIHIVAAMPLNANGKIDRNALAATLRE